MRSWGAEDLACALCALSNSNCRLHPVSGGRWTSQRLIGKVQLVAASGFGLAALACLRQTPAPSSSSGSWCSGSAQSARRSQSGCTWRAPASACRTRSQNPASCGWDTAPRWGCTAPGCRPQRRPPPATASGSSAGSAARGGCVRYHRRPSASKESARAGVRVWWAEEGAEGLPMNDPSTRLRRAAWRSRHAALSAGATGPARAVGSRACGCAWL